MIFTDTNLAGVLLIDLQRREDERGYFARAWCAKEFSDHGLPNFVQTNMSLCRRKGTVRGLHWQAQPHGEAKFMRCIRGSIFDVVVDVRPDSPTFGRWMGVELTSENRRAIYIPEGCAHAYQALTDDAEVLYSASRAYAPGSERGIRWNDPAFNIEWPIAEVIVSDKDRAWPDFKMPVTAATT
jgi:dTDP-4-dehydrorhamnose 3,5-epimerase